jgi:carotenoid cleavage dioxygenase-like enzyme
MEGSLPPDLEGTLFRVGPADVGAGTEWPGALHAVELREGRAVSYLRRDAEADAGVFWHGGSVLALPEAGLPSQFSRLLEPEEFTGGLTVPVASHTHRIAADGSRVLFAVDDGRGSGSRSGSEEAEIPSGVFLRFGEWDAHGALRRTQAVELERATWQHDIGVTSAHIVFIESPTTRLHVGTPDGTPDEGEGEGEGVGDREPRVPFGWVPGAEGWVGVVPRTGDGSTVRWFRVDPCLVTHVLGAWDTGPGDHPIGSPSGGDDIVLYVCRYDAPKEGHAIDRAASVVGAGIGLSAIGGSLPVLERWTLRGDRLERVQLDERHVEYPRIDPLCEGDVFRYGYAVELAWGPDAVAGAPTGQSALPVGLLKYDLARDEAAAWQPGPGAAPREPLFVRAADGHADDEGWLLCLVDDPDRGMTDLVILDASSLGRRGPEAVIHLPARLPLRAHGEWVPADRYR